MENEKKHTNQSANELLVAGTALGAVGAVGALATGAACPICLVAAPLLVGIGLVKKLKKRRTAIGLGLLMGAVVLGATVKTSWARSEKMHRVVFELTSDNPEQWAATLNNVENLQKAFGKEHTEIEVVAHGKGLGALSKTNTSSGERITAISNAGVRFAACQNTMRKMHLTKGDLLPVSQTVDSGVAELVRKQEAGWAYLKSSP